MDNLNTTPLDKLIDDRIKAALPRYFRQQGFTDRKLTDTPTDSLQVVNRKFVTSNGSVAGRPASSVATVGQFYLNTENNQPMWYTTAGWVDGNASIVAQNT